MTRDLGDMGEGLFSHWCGQAGLTHNRAERDRKGWDFLVEGPPRRVGDPTSGQAPQWLGVRVQVKATDGDKLRWPGIKLSVWDRLCRSPSPAFVLVVGFGGGIEPQWAALVEMNEERIRKFYRRLRTLRADGERLHESEMTLNWTEAELLDEVNGCSMGARLERVVGGHLQDYVARKLGWIKHAASITGEISMTMPLPGSSGGVADDRTYEELVDFAIGLADSVTVPVDDFRLDGRRPFSDLGHPERSVVTLSNNRRVPVGRARVEFSTEDGRRRVDLEMDVFHPAAQFPFIPPEKVKVRLSTDWLEMVLHPARDEVVVKIDIGALNQLRPLLHLRQFSRLVHVLHFGEGRFETALTLPNGDRIRSAASMPAPLEVQEEVRIATDLVDFVWDICDELGVPPTELTSLDALLDQEQGIRGVRVVLQRPEYFRHFRGSADLPLHGYTKQLGVPVVFTFGLGQYYILVGGAAYGSPTISPSENTEYRAAVELRNPEVQVVVRKVLHESDVNDDLVRNAYSTIVDWLDGEGMDSLAPVGFTEE